MKTTIKNLALLSLIALPTTTMANVSSTVTATSDYTFNGVSQTDNGPALQASLDYAADAGWYVGTWASNVDYGSGDDTWLELDFYGGIFYQLSESVSVDAGIAYYTYHGDSFSDEYQYPEVYTKFGYGSPVGQTELNFWYTWDYFGVDAGHYILMAAHTFTITEGHEIRISFDRSTSTDENKWSWDGDKAYNHYRAEYMTSWKGFDFNLAVEDTSMDIDTADTRAVLSVARTFNF
ncbi:TorF family putative porin [Shewanella sp. Isolate13]|uniref:TorF family putative porin n=1 Tax=Shewanella sp. Isolate13 TaxID=2908531 RepID=UPI001EFE9366|nr:TorF family putative porin [Shewanella sp. Isolate13]MCG9729922.1 TorF family putative porin [Shewanella sp. Isolate13]